MLIEDIGISTLNYVKHGAEGMIAFLGSPDQRSGGCHRMLTSSDFI